MADALGITICPGTVTSRIIIQNWKISWRQGVLILFLLIFLNQIVEIDIFIFSVVCIFASISLQFAFHQHEMQIAFRGVRIFRLSVAADSLLVRRQ